MKILFVASECSPFAKVGGLADVVGSLPKYLLKLGVDVRIVIPKYEMIGEKKYNLKLISSFYLKREKIKIWQSFLPENNVILYLLENKKYLSSGEIYLPAEDFNSLKRFLFFSQAVLEIFPKINFFPEILHCHDWETGILPSLIKTKSQKIKTLLTIHNLPSQGEWEAKDIFNFLKLKGNELENLKVRDGSGDFNILQQGVLEADILTTVSPTYAKEILTKEYGEELEADLKKRKKALFGILNGIDTEIFNPATDPNLKTNYSQRDFGKKKINKFELQEILKLPKNPLIPLAGFISRLVEQKGLDLIEKIIPDLIKLNFQMVFLGKGEKKYEEMLLKFSKKYPENISANIKFDPSLAQKIYAGADIFLIPSLFEPCGLIQMLAMRYGSIPVARKTGGLSDTIEDGKTGFLFKNYLPSDFLKAVKRCLKIFREKRGWEKIVKRAMTKDFSWKKSAQEYLKLYKKLLKNEFSCLKTVEKNRD